MLFAGIVRMKLFSLFNIQRLSIIGYSMIYVRYLFLPNKPICVCYFWNENLFELVKVIATAVSN